jgi:Ca-activated chloride channel family protein
MVAVPLTIMSQLAREPLPVTGERQLAYLLVEIRPSEAASPLPVNLALLLDRSGSMRGPRLAAVKDGIARAIDLLTPQDKLTIVAFDDTVDLIATAQPVEDPDRLKSAALLIEDGGGTVLAPGMGVGLAELRRVAAPDRASQVIVLTDGVSRDDADQCEQLAMQAGAAGVPIIPLGCGAEWDFAQLEAIAALSGGPPPEFLRTPADIAPGIIRHVRAARTVVARGARAQIRFVAGVTPRRASQVAPFMRPCDAAIEDRSATVLLGDIAVGVPHALLFELLVEPKRGGTFRLAQVEIAMLGEEEPVRADVVVVFSASSTKRPRVRPVVAHYVERAIAARLVLYALSHSDGADRPAFAPNIVALFSGEAREQLDLLAAGTPLSPEGRKTLLAQVSDLTGSWRSLAESLEGDR